MLDDQLWHQALVMDCILESLRGSEQGPNNAMMWTLLRRGIVDADTVDCQGHSTLTLPVYYSAPSQGQLVQLVVLTR